MNRRTSPTRVHAGVASCRILGAFTRSAFGMGFWVVACRVCHSHALLAKITGNAFLSMARGYYPAIDRRRRGANRLGLVEHAMARASLQHRAPGDHLFREQPRDASFPFTHKIPRIARGARPRRICVWGPPLGPDRIYFRSRGRNAKRSRKTARSTGTGRAFCSHFKRAI